MTTDKKTRLFNARTFMEQNNFEQALQCLEPLQQDSPPDKDVRYMSAVCYRYLEKWSQAKLYLDELTSNWPSYGRGQQELGHFLSSQNKINDALTAYRTAVKCNPSLYASWQKLAQLSSQISEQEAAKYNLEYLQQLPAALRAVLNLLHEEKIDHAEQLCRKFLQQQPKHIEAIRLLAQIADKLNVLDDAELLLTKILNSKPDYHWARYDLVNVLYRRQKFSIAFEHAKQLFEVMPDDTSINILYANQLAAMGEYAEAQQLYQKVLGIEPNNAAVYMQLGHLYKTLGQQQNAVNAYQQAIKHHPHFGDAYWSLANLKTYQFQPNELDTMQEMLNETTLNEDDRVHFNFALAKAYEDQQLFEKAFHCYQTGNSIRKNSTQYSADRMREAFERQKQFFNYGVAQKLKQCGNEAISPIFIVGLPRSGSTLIEQILSSHSQIEGTMELPHVLSYVHELNGRLTKNQVRPYPDNIAQLSAQQLKDMGKRYLDETKPYRSGKPYFIDKMPNNFRHIGLIKTILPNAKIIDTRRPAMSCCFSNFKQLFAEGQEFSYSLEDVALYYRDYVSLMDHWHQVYPNELMTIQYQDVVEDTQNTIDALFTYLNLPIEPSCYEFYKTDRAVRTASAEQVRQPINRKGLEQWQNFKPYLDELSSLLVGFD